MAKEYLFQFQYGLIKRDYGNVVLGPGPPFQFQYGLIKSGSPIITADDISISIPIWFD